MRYPHLRLSALTKHVRGTQLLRADLGEMDHSTLHDFRRYFSSTMAKLRRRCTSLNVSSTIARVRNRQSHASIIDMTLRMSCATPLSVTKRMFSPRSRRALLESLRQPQK